MINKIICGGLLLLLVGIFFTRYWEKNPPYLYPFPNQHHMFVIEQAGKLVGFDLVDPEQAPPSIHESVIRGYHIMMNTPLYAPNYVQDQLSCTHCHFLGGDTLGGKNNGISLVGVTTTYPRYSKRDNRVISLSDRINNCFERSLNGKPLPKNSEYMEDILAYLKWISKEVEQIQQIPWLGLKFLQSNHVPNPKQGAYVYQTYCALCHKANGEGGGVLIKNEGKTIPPIWGPHSFNDGAGMNRLPMLAAFVYWNMPYQDARLTEEEAIDVAAFILKQPRPHFVEGEQR